MLIPFARQSNAEEYSGERLLNYFIRPSNGAISPAVLMARSGLAEAADAGNRIRNMVVMQGDIYAVANGTVWNLRNNISCSVCGVSLSRVSGSC